MRGVVFTQPVRSTLRGGSSAASPGTAAKPRFGATTPGADGVPYFIYRAQPDAPFRGTLVIVHGIGRNSLMHATHLGRVASATGYHVVAPHFSRHQFRRFQLAYDPDARANAATGLIRVLADASLQHGIDTARPVLIGYSGGAQFAHRAVLAGSMQPRAMILVAPGWYTFPDTTTDWPRGLRAGPTQPLDAVVRLVEVPTAVMVGERDTRRGASLNTDPHVDLQQGQTRVERAERWVAAVRRAASCVERAPNIRLRLIPKATHDAQRNFLRHQLAERIVSEANFLTKQSGDPYENL